jgi:hypothetical protein
MKIIIGKNFVPSYPIFILIILQASETGNPHELQASSYGHYYQYLIYKTLSKHLKSQESFNTFFNYLSDLAFYCFENNLKSISSNELDLFHAKYRDEYDIGFGVTDVIDTLVQSQLLEKFEDFYEFKYLYIYYYFVAKKLARDINAQETKNLISALSMRLYRAEYANIFMFLTHHSKDEFILEEILKNARLIFADQRVCRLENDISIIHELADELPKLVLKTLAIDKSREEQLKIEEDEDERLDDESEGMPEASLEEDVTEIDFNAKINLAFKTIEILGQILRNGSGEIRAAPKLALATETYMVGLRALNVFFAFFLNFQEFIIKQIADEIIEKNVSEDQKEKIERISKTILFGICAQLSFTFIKKVSDSIGSESLRKTLAEIRDSNEFVSVELIDFAIKLDHFRKFPETEMKELNEKTTKLPLSSFLMRRFVLKYLYLFHTDFREKQKICSYLGISMGQQRFIDTSSKDTKKEKQRG